MEKGAQIPAVVPTDEYVVTKLEKLPRERARMAVTVRASIVPEGMQVDGSRPDRGRGAEHRPDGQQNE